MHNIWHPIKKRKWLGAHTHTQNTHKPRKYDINRKINKKIQVQKYHRHWNQQRSTLKSYVNILHISHKVEKSLLKRKVKNKSIPFEHLIMKKKSEMKNTLQGIKNRQTSERVFIAIQKLFKIKHARKFYKTHWSKSTGDR